MAPQTKEMILNFVKELAVEVSVVLGNKLIALPEMIQKKAETKTDKEIN